MKERLAELALEGVDRAVNHGFLWRQVRNLIWGIPRAVVATLPIVPIALFLPPPWMELFCGLWELIVFGAMLRYASQHYWATEASGWRHVTAERALANRPLASALPVPIESEPLPAVLPEVSQQPFCARVTEENLEAEGWRQQRRVTEVWG